MTDSFMQILLAAGGAAVTVGAILAALGKLTLDATLERFKHSQAEQLERLKNELAFSSAQLSRYQGAQFGKYQEIWETLSDLRVSADRLWERVSARNIEEFDRHFGAARRLVYANEVVIEDTHLQRLRTLIDNLREFHDGKEGLLELYRAPKRDDAAIEELIQRNGALRKRYGQALDDLAVSMKAQLQGKLER